MKKVQQVKLIFTLLFLTLFQSFTYGQNNTGAIFLSASDYAALPRPNWSDIQSYSTNVPNADGTYATSGVVMLNNPPIGDQGTEGSCVGWAVGYTAMGILTYPKFNCWDVARRSPSYVYNQIKVGAGCGGGSFPRDALNLVRDQGVCSWNLLPYINGACTVLPNTTQANDATANKAINWAALNTNDFLGIKRALDLGFPVIIAFNVTQDFDNMWSSGGIWSTNNGTSRGGHATCVVGYDDTRQQFKVQNQWGPFGGDDGYFWVTYNLIANNCCRELYILYGATPSIPIGINGADNLCSSSTGSYTINSLPCNAVVGWTLTNNDDSQTSATVSPNTGIPVTVTIPSGIQTTYLKLTATISGVSPSIPPIVKQIFVGAPYFGATYKNGITDGNPLAIYIPSQGTNNTFNNVCIGYRGVPNVYIDAQPAGSNNINWSVPYGYGSSAFSLYTGYGNRAYFGWNYGGTTPPGYIQASVSNGCGTYSKIFAFQQINCGSPGGDPCPGAKGTNYYTISPNPASDNIKIGITNKPVPIKCDMMRALNTSNGIVFSVINVYNNIGTLVKSYKTKNAKTATIQIGDLIAGSYQVEIIQADYIEKQQIIIRK